jgi:hypothetical protein
MNELTEYVPLGCNSNKLDKRIRVKINVDSRKRVTYLNNSKIFIDEDGHELSPNEFSVPFEVENYKYDLYKFQILEFYPLNGKTCFPSDLYIILKKLSFNEWKDKYLAFFPPSGFLGDRKPTFYFGKKKNGIITTTYPIALSVVKYFRIGWLQTLNDGVVKSLIFPKTKFLFFPYEDTGSLRFQYGQMLPLFQERNKPLDFSPISYLDKGDFFWGNGYFLTEINEINSYYSLEPLNKEFPKELWKTHYKDFSIWEKESKTIEAFLNFEKRLDRLIDQEIENQELRTSQNRESDSWMDDPDDYWNVD